MLALRTVSRVQAASATRTARKVAMRHSTRRMAFSQLSSTWQKTKDFANCSANVEPENELSKFVVDMHVFFVKWYNGTLGETAKEAAKIEEARSALMAQCAEDFCYIMPGGSEGSKEDLDSMLEATYGKNKSFKIQVKDISVKELSPEIRMVRYNEFQKGAKMSADRNARTTTLLLRKDKTHGYQMFHMQETWLPDKSVEYHDYKSF